MERDAADAELDAAGRALDDLAERAAARPAGSPAGALFALVLAAGDLESLAISSDDPAPALERLARRLWTIRGALEPALAREARLPEIVSDYWMPRRLAPEASHRL